MPDRGTNLAEAREYLCQLVEDEMARQGVEHAQIRRHRAEQYIDRVFRQAGEPGEDGYLPVPDKVLMTDPRVQALAAVTGQPCSHCFGQRAEDAS